MENQIRLELVYQLEAEKLNHPDGWIETRLKQTDLLVYEDEKSLEGKFCLVVMHSITDQDVLKIIYEVVRSWGYNSSAYMTGHYWNCPFLDVRVFFEANDNGLFLQKRTDQIIKKMADKINGLTKDWV